MDKEAAYNDFVNSFVHSSSLEQIGSESPLECVIVEPRNHPALRGVLHNVAYFLPNASFTIYHSSENAEFVKDIVGAAPIKLVNFRSGNMGRDGYNELLRSPEFWECRAGERTLIYQTDTALLQNTVARFWDYAYVGAPWTWSEIGDPFFWVGNGGLSLRDTAFSVQAAHAAQANPHLVKLPEDCYFAYSALYAQRLPSKEVAAAFSMEYLYHPNPMGFHQAYRLEVHSPEVRASLLHHFDTSASQCKKTCILDAWIENTRDGRVYDIPNLVSRLKVAIGPTGLRMPQGSRMWDRYLDGGAIVAQPKRLAIEWKHEGESQVMLTMCKLDPKLRIACDLETKVSTK